MMGSPAAQHTFRVHRGQTFGPIGRLLALALFGEPTFTENTDSGLVTFIAQ